MIPRALNQGDTEYLDNDKVKYTAFVLSRRVEIFNDTNYLREMKHRQRSRSRNRRGKKKPEGDEDEDRPRSLGMSISPLNSVD